VLLALILRFQAVALQIQMPGVVGDLDLKIDMTAAAIPARPAD
jgi:hypothetical protein